MREVLRLRVPDDRVHPARNELDQLINTPPDLSTEETSPPFTIRTANSFWGQIGFPFRDSFLDVMAVDYDSGIYAADFATKPEEARVAINQWTKDATEDRIVDLLQPGIITPRTRLVLVNAIWFNAGWYSRFDPAATSSGKFTLPDGSKVQADMMHAEMRARFLNAEGYKAAELRYLGDADIVFVVPDHGRFDEVVAGFGADEYTTTIDRLETRILTIALPKFEFGSSFELKPVLAELGMAEAFTAAADFSGITEGGGLYLAEVVHQTFISLDENGTEAAAATAATFELSAPAPATLRLNRPFLFIIKHRSTDEILFIGQVVDPTAGPSGT
jgi:serpin B